MMLEVCLDVVMSGMVMLVDVGHGQGAGRLWTRWEDVGGAVRDLGGGDAWRDHAGTVCYSLRRVGGSGAR